MNLNRVQAVVDVLRDRIERRMVRIRWTNEHGIQVGEVAAREISVGPGGDLVIVADDRRGALRHRLGGAE